MPDNATVDWSEFEAVPATNAPAAAKTVDWSEFEAAPAPAAKSVLPPVSSPDFDPGRYSLMGGAMGMDLGYNENPTVKQPNPFTPLVTLPRPSAETVVRAVGSTSDADKYAMVPDGRFFGPGIPEAQIPEVAASKPAQIATGAVSGAEGLAEGLTSPVGIATLGMGELPAVAQRGVALAFAGQMVAQTPEIARQLGTEFGKPADQRDWKKIAELTTQAAGTTGFTVAGALHGLKPSSAAVPSQPEPSAPINAAIEKEFNQPATGVPRRFTGLTPEQVSDLQQERIAEAKRIRESRAFDRQNAQPPTTGAPNASSEQETAAVHGDVQPRPVQGEGQVPVQESGGGIQPQTGGGLRPDAQTEEGEVPLTGAEPGPTAKKTPVPQVRMNPVDEHEFAEWARGKTVRELRQLRDDHEDDPMEKSDHAIEIINRVIAEKSKSLTMDSVRADQEAPAKATGQTSEQANTQARLAAQQKHQEVLANAAAAVPGAETTPPGVKPGAKEWLTQAAMRKDSGTGKRIFTGPNHPAILEERGIAKNFPTRESRNAPAFGFETNKRKFVTREQAAKIAKAAGQQLEPFETGPGGHPVAHSGDVQAPEKAQPSPMSEQAAPVATPPETPAKAVGKVGDKIDQIRAQGQRMVEKRDAQAAKQRQQKANDIKQELIDRLQQALMKAQPAEHAKPGETVTIEIPDDGKFTVVNTVEAISTVLEKARKLDTKIGKTGVPRAALKVRPEFKEAPLPPGATRTSGGGVSLPSEPLPAKPIGMGGATPEEFQAGQGRPTSNKNAVVDAERAQRGLPPMMATLKRTWGEAWDQAMARIDTDPTWQDKLIAELRDKPRPVTDVENAALLHRRVDLTNELEKAMREAALAYDDGRMDDVQSAKQRIANWSDELSALEDATKKGGTETGRALAARKMMANEDFSLARMVMEKRAANDGKPLTPEQTEEVTKLHQKISDLQKRLDDYESQKDELGANEAGDEAVKRVRRKVSADKEKTSSVDLAAQRKTLVTGIREAAKEGADAQDLRSFVQSLAENFVRSGITERDPLVDAVHGVLKDIIPDITRRETMDAISGYGDFKPLDPDAIKAQLRDLKGQMQQVAKLEDLQARKPLSKTGVERRAPSDEQRRLIKQVNEAKKKFGVVTTDPARQLKSALDAIKTRLRNQIADLDHQLATREKTVKAKSPSPEDAETKALKSQRDALKEQFDDVFGREKKPVTDEQRAAAAANNLQRQITDLENRLREGNQFQGKQKRAPVSTPELESMRQRRDLLKDELGEIQAVLDPKKTPEERALAALKTRLRNSTADLQSRLARGDFSKTPRKATVPDAEAVTLRAENERAKQSFRDALEADRRKNRSRSEKAADWLVKWHRFNVISGLTSLAKIGIAGVTRIGMTAADTAAGLGINKIPGIRGVAERATREGLTGGHAVEHLIKGYVEGWMYAVQQAGNVLKTGRTDIEAAAKTQHYPPSLLNYMGNLHSLMKLPAFAQEYKVSLRMRAADAVRNGVDMTEPANQMRVSDQAVQDGLRAKFSHDNFVTKRLNMLLNSLEKSKEHATAAKIIAKTLRFLMPVVHIPTNYFVESATYSNLGVGLPRAAMLTLDGIRKGTETLTPEQADSIMRHWKKGAIGAGLLLLGYYQRDKIGGYYQPNQKQDPNKPQFGGIRLFGVNLPRWAVHLPMFEPLHLGATIGHVMDHITKKTGEHGSITDATVAGVAGLLDEMPYVSNARNATQLLAPDAQGKYARGETIKSAVVPQLMSQVAAYADRDAAGKQINRKPDTIVQHLESGIPGLRKNVPVNRRNPVLQ